MKKYVLLFSLLGIIQSVFPQNVHQQKLAEYIERAADLERFSGVVLVQKGNETLLKKSYGITDVTNKVPITLETSFDIGSISKQFTATAILKLCDQGKIELNAPINTYLGKFASKRWKRVTVHHLLSHQSGIPSILQSGQGLDDYWPETRPITWEEQMNYFKDLKLMERPGEEYRYNNTGYILLALIVENVSGKPFDKYMQEDVFQPNGLTRTAVGCSTLSSYAKNHYHYPKALMELVPEYHVSWYKGAGGVYSTATDLSTWADALYNGDILSNNSRTAMFSRQARNYGYGWVIEKKDELTTIHHDGTNFGSAGFVLLVPDEDIRIVILTNQTHKELNKLGKSEDWIKEIAYDFLDIMHNQRVELLPEPAKQPQNEDLGKYVGMYKFDDSTGSLVISQNDECLQLKADEIDHSIFRHFVHQEISDSTSPLLPKAKKAFNALSRRKFWKFSKYCDGEMKFVSYSGLLSIGYKMIVKDLGEIHKTVVYEIGKNYAISRFFGENKAVDFIVYFNDENEISGLFDIEYSDALTLKSAHLSPLTDNKFLLDGFAIGEVDAEFELKHKDGLVYLQMTQNGRVFLAKKQ